MDAGKNNGQMVNSYPIIRGRGGGDLGGRLRYRTSYHWTDEHDVEAPNVSDENDSGFRLNRSCYL